MSKLNQEFRQAIAVLKQTNEDFRNGHTTSVAHARTREAALRAALTALARHHGVLLAYVRGIDGNGEFRIAAVTKKGDNPAHGCAPFGPAFTALLNTAKPRTGIIPCALSPDNGWCYLNHFEVERLVLGVPLAN